MAEDGIRDLVRSRGLGDVYKRQRLDIAILYRYTPVAQETEHELAVVDSYLIGAPGDPITAMPEVCLLYTSDAADERSSVDLGGRRIIKKKKKQEKKKKRKNKKHKKKKNKNMTNRERKVYIHENSVEIICSK